MKHALIHAIAHAVIYAASFCYAAPPKLSLTASKATTSGGTSINVARDERVTIQVAAESGSVISIVTFPEFTYITPSSKSELTFYAGQSARIVVVAVKGAEATQQKIDVIVSGGPTPPPPPPPGPDVPTSVIGKAAYEAAMAVKSPTRAADAAVIAKGMRAAHAKAVAVATMTGSQIIQEAIAAFAKLPDASKPVWIPFGPAMFKTLQAELGDKPERAKAIAAVEEMAKAMEAVK